MVVKMREYYRLVETFQNSKFILNKGLCLLYPKFVKNTSINTDKDGLAYYDHPEDVNTYFEDQLKYNELVEHLKSKGILGKIKSYLFAIPPPLPKEIINLTKERINKVNLSSKNAEEQIDLMFDRLLENLVKAGEIDNSFKGEIECLYKKQIRLRNS